MKRLKKLSVFLLCLLSAPAFSAATIQEVASYANGSNATDHSLDISGWTLSSGDLILVSVHSDGTPAISPPATVSSILGPIPSSSGQTRSQVFSGLSDGTETALLFTTDQSQGVAICALRITGHDGVTPVVGATIDTGEREESGIDAIASGTVDSAEYLWITGVGGDGVAVASAAPTTYGIEIQDQGGYGGGAHCMQASKVATAVSDDPAGWTFSSGDGEQQVTWTLAVNPGAASSQSPVPIILQQH